MNEKNILLKNILRSVCWSLEEERRFGPAAQPLQYGPKSRVLNEAVLVH
jgi:hypothetical protein